MGLNNNVFTFQGKATTMENLEGGGEYCRPGNLEGSWRTTYIELNAMISE